MKKWYLSKTLWINFLAGVAVLAQAILGESVFDAEVQAAILVIVNLVLRVLTKQALG